MKPIIFIILLISIIYSTVDHDMIVRHGVMLQSIEKRMDRDEIDEKDRREKFQELESMISKGSEAVNELKDKFDKGYEDRKKLWEAVSAVKKDQEGGGSGDLIQWILISVFGIGGGGAMLKNKMNAGQQQNHQPVKKNKS